MAGGAALTLAAWHPQQFIFAGSLSGFLNPSQGLWPTLIGLAMKDAGGYNADDMWGPSERRRLAAQRPDGQHQTAGRQQHRHVDLLRQRRPSDLDGGGDFGVQLQRAVPGEHHANTNKEFQKQYAAAGGRNAVFNFPPNGTHSWGYWGSQLQAMKPDMVRILTTPPPPPRPPHRHQRPRSRHRRAPRPRRRLAENGCTPTDLGARGKPERPPPPSELCARHANTLNLNDSWLRVRHNRSASQAARAPRRRGAAGPQAGDYGFQHVVAFYAGAVLVPILIASAIGLPARTGQADHRRPVHLRHRLDHPGGRLLEGRRSAAAAAGRDVRGRLPHHRDRTGERRRRRRACSTSTAR